MSYRAIRLERNGPVARLVLDRPGQHNAMTPEMGREVIAATRDLAADADLRVVVVAGEGDAFCSGGDLGLLAGAVGLDHGATNPETGGAFAENPRAFYEAFLSVTRLPVPTLAEIRGPAIGAGLCLALACDLRVAGRSARMGMTFTRVGIHPGMGATELMVRAVGWPRAFELLTTGRTLRAEEAAGFGLVNRVVDDNRVRETVDGLAEEICAAAPLAVRAVKATLWEDARGSLDEALAREARAQTATLDTDDAREGVLAVLERRRPRFTGR